MRRSILTSLATTLLIAVGCGVPPPRFGLDHNGVRKARGLPVVEPTWTVYQSLVTEAQWSSGYKFDATAGHAGKKVFYKKNGPITAEEDYYYSGKKFVPTWDPDAGTISEMITVHYDYTATDSPWQCSHCRKDDLATIALEQAEETLQAWGLQRLNYTDANRVPADRPSRSATVPTSQYSRRPGQVQPRVRPLPP